ncbi:MAG: hypothetical protein K0Q51_638 [Rickettsiaceae bacterium]|jgi:hypothetical protein|nr:hypothetical protein [Rickettsiaceae bacterium]
MSKDKSYFEIIKDTIVSKNHCHNFLKTVKKDPIKAIPLLKGDHSLSTCFNQHWEMDNNFKISIVHKKFPGHIEQFLGLGWSPEQNIAFERIEQAAYYIENGWEAQKINHLLGNGNHTGDGEA